MATEFENSIEDSEMADCDDEKVVTMMDVLQQQENFEEDANAVLGASDDKNCTYSKGYIKRQAIYACMTCCSEAKNDPTKYAGICLACCLTCHENHELIELYTKRNFKCDCGNAKFNSYPCQFTPNKVDINDNNSYNQNFVGVYCICHRPYPDPESTVEDEMIQCIICEDWLHASHLEAPVPDNDHYCEMICKSCMEQNNFLHDYSYLAVNVENVDSSMINGIDSKKNKVYNGDNKFNESTDISNEYENLKLHNDFEMSNENIEVAFPTTTNSLVIHDPKIVHENTTNISQNKIIDNETIVVEADNRNTCSNTFEKKELSIDTENKLGKESFNMAVEISEPKNSDFESISDLEPPRCSGNVEPFDKDAECEKVSIIENNINEICISETAENNNDSNLDSCTNTLAEVLDNTTVNQEQENDNSKMGDAKIMDIQNELVIAVKVPDHECIKKSVEQIEENVLLAEPEEANGINHKANKSHSKILEANQFENIKNAEQNDLKGNPTLENSDVNSTSTLKSERAEVLSDINVINIANTIPEPESTNHIIVTEQKPDIDINNIKNGNEITMQDDTLTVDNTNKFQLDSTAIEANQAETENKFDTNINSNNEWQKVETLNISDRGSEKRKLSTEEVNNVAVKKLKLDEIYIESCVRPRGLRKIYKGATFWPSNFRQKLCNCRECITMYKDLSVLFLIDPEDTVTAYENLGKQNINGRPASQYEKGLQALSSLDRIQQINALTEYNKMRDKLLDFLKSFKDRQEIVKEEDIKAFFAGMKPKREPDGVYFCK